MNAKTILFSLAFFFTLVASFAQTKDTCHSLICYANNKSEITKNFMKKNTIIDSVYLSRNGYRPGDTTNFTFTGDTLFNINKNYSAIIIDYNDGLVCSDKFILSLI
jgi:ubiquinone biosynthesis protein COQ9